MSEQPPGPRPPHHGGSIERTLAGEAKLDVGEVLRESWQLVDGIKGIIIGGVLLVNAALLVALAVLGALFGADQQSVIGGAIIQLVAMMIAYPFFAGVFMLGLNRSAGRPVRFEDLFSRYRNVLQLVAVGALQSLVTFIGLMLYVLPGLYLAIALSLAIPLKIERDLAITDCLLTSLRLVNRKFVEVTVLTFASIGLVLLGFLSLVGWIWTLPWSVMILAVIYRQLAGYTPGDGGGAAPTQDPPGSGTAGGGDGKVGTFEA